MKNKKRHRWIVLSVICLALAITIPRDYILIFLNLLAIYAAGMGIVFVGFRPIWFAITYIGWILGLVEGEEFQKDAWAAQKEYGYLDWTGNSRWSMSLMISGITVFFIWMILILVEIDPAETMILFK